jgi:hypothetical protein
MDISLAEVEFLPFSIFWKYQFCDIDDGGCESNSISESWLHTQQQSRDFSSWFSCPSLRLSSSTYFLQSVVCYNIKIIERLIGVILVQNRKRKNYNGMFNKCGL